MVDFLVESREHTITSLVAKARLPCTSLQADTSALRITATLCGDAIHARASDSVTAHLRGMEYIEYMRDSVTAHPLQYIYLKNATYRSKDCCCRSDHDRCSRNTSDFVRGGHDIHPGRCTRNILKGGEWIKATAYHANPC